MKAWRPTSRAISPTCWGVSAVPWSLSCTTNSSQSSRTHQLVKRQQRQRRKNETEWPKSWNTGSRAKFAKLIHNTLFWYFSVQLISLLFKVRLFVWVAFIFKFLCLYFEACTSAVNFLIVMEYFSTDFQKFTFKSIFGWGLKLSRVRLYFVVCRF